MKDNVISQAQFRQGKLEKALETFERALVINPFNPIPRFHKAKALEAHGSLEVNPPPHNALPYTAISL